MTRRDADGFSVAEDRSLRPAPVKVAPPVVAMPRFFDGCASSDEAIARTIDELAKPASVHADGYDVMYRRLADALILVLANQGKISP